MNQQGLQNPNQPSGELLAMINKGAVGGQLGGLGGMGQNFDRQQQHHQPAQSNQNSVAASPIQNQVSISISSCLLCLSKHPSSPNVLWLTIHPS